MDKQILEKELEERLTARGLIRYAWDYFQSFEDLCVKYPNVIQRYEVKYYLLCHSIELAIKAFLRQKGYSRKKLINIGHDLEWLITELYKHEVIMDIDSTIRAITANKYYKTKQFEYPQIGYKSLPDLRKMRDSTNLLLKMVTNSITKQFP